MDVARCFRPHIPNAPLSERGITPCKLPHSLPPAWTRASPGPFLPDLQRPRWRSAAPCATLAFPEKVYATILDLDAITASRRGGFRSRGNPARRVDRKSTRL